MVKHAVVIGAGIGGLTTAAVLARSGMRVTVLEAHVYPGGCAGTFYHQKYLFDAGATLAGGFYPGGPMDLVAREAGVKRWPAKEDDLAMVVHLPGGNPGVRHILGPHLHRPLDGDNVFAPQGVGLGMDLMVYFRIKDHLGHPISIPQIHEDQAAVISPGLDPAHQDDMSADISFSQIPTGMGAPPIA